MLDMCLRRFLMVKVYEVGEVYFDGETPVYDKVKEMSQKIERLEFDNEALEMAHNEGKEINAELSSKNEKLEKKLKIATKALKKYMTFCRHPAEEALKEMEDVK